MKALVVYESMYGNTARIARAIGSGLAEAGVLVTIAPIDAADAATTADTDLLVVGGPTHAHGLSSASTRDTAVKDRKNTFDEPTVGAGLREWLPAIAQGEGRPAAAFDTRIGGPPAWLTGSAAKHVGTALDDRGFSLACEPTSFLVTKRNELVDGEIERAERWGASVAAALSVAP
jgi:hypothetical protein